MRPAGRAIVAAALATGLLAPAGCAPPQYEQNWQSLRPGMTRDQVEALLGKPSSTYVPPPAKGEDAAPGRPRERWQYGDTLSSLGTRALFPDEADERAWRVFFGADGRVTEFERPAWNAARSGRSGAAE
jgi:hypothetical protein